MAVFRFGRVQLRIMQVLWEKGQATAREITDALSEREDIAHSTVQTLLRKLEAKGAVAHKARNRTFVFRALARPEDVKRKATREFIERLFGGSPGGLVSYLLCHEPIPPKEIEEIRRLINQPERETDAGEEAPGKRRG